MPNSAPIAYDTSFGLTHDQPTAIWPSYYDADGDTVSVSGYTQPAHGSVTFDNTSKIFNYTPAAGYVGEDNFTYTVTDGTDTATANVQITLQNAAPIAYGGNLGLTHDHATSFWPSYYDADGDTVSVSGFVHPLHGTLTFDTASNMFVYTPAAGYVGEDSFTYTVTDGIDTATANVQITLQNAAPIAYGGSMSLTHDHATTFWPSSYDADGDAVSVSGFTQPAHGSVTYDSTSNIFTYTPSAGYVGEDNFTYTVTDGIDTATANVQFTLQNTAPIAYGSNLSLTHDHATSFWPSYYDADGDTVSVSGFVHPLHGTLTFDTASNMFVYTPAAGYVGEDSFTYTVTDGIDIGTATVQITLQNTAPIAYGGSMSLTHDRATTFWPSSYDADGDAVSVSGFTQPAHGSVTYDSTSNIFTYTPSAGYVGEDNFTYTVTDGIDTATANVQITLQNAAPIAYGSNLSLTHDHTTTIWMSYYDADGDAVSVSGFTQPAHGSVTFNTTSKIFTYTPVTGYVGEDSFTYTVTDGIDSGTATVQISLQNTAPSAFGNTFGLLHDRTTSFSPSYNDPDGDPTAVSGYSQPQHGSLSYDSVSKLFSYTPAAGYTGTDSFTYMVTDGLATSSAVIQFNIYNNAPTVYDTSMSLLHDHTAFVWPMSNDPDGDTVSITSYSQPGHGSAIFDSMSQSFIYTPAAGFVGTDTFTYTVTDGVATATAHITLTVYNNAPQTTDSSTRLFQDQSAVIWPSFSDADGDTVTVSSYSQPMHGTVTYDNVSNSFIYVPASAYLGTDSFTYTVSDGAATATATVSLRVISTVAPTITLTSNLDGTYCTFTGQVTDDGPLGGLTVTLSGALNDTVQTAADGSFSLATYPPSLGTVYAVVTDSDGLTSNTASTVLTSNPPQIINFLAVLINGNTWEFRGRVIDEACCPMIVFLGGIAPLQGKEILTDPYGYFSYQATVNFADYGTATAQARDPFGLLSTVVGSLVH